MDNSGESSAIMEPKTPNEHEIAYNHPITPERIESIVRIQERYRLARFVVVSAAILGALWMILSHVVQMFELGWPAVAGGTIVTGGPTIVAMRFQAEFRQWVKSACGRTKELELKIDARRESSGLNSDGSVPKDEP